MWPNPQLPADLVTFTEKILDGKLQILCSGYADDITPYSVEKNQCDLETKLQKASVRLF